MTEGLPETGFAQDKARLFAEADTPAAETGIAAAAPRARKGLSRRAVDWLLAGCICAAALGYWAWDGNSQASAHLTWARAASPDATGSLDSAGALRYAAHDYAVAEILFRQAVAKNPNDVLGYCNLGAALTAEGRYDEGITALRRALQLDPNSALARNNLNWALGEKAKHAK